MRERKEGMVGMAFQADIMRDGQIPRRNSQKMLLIEDSRMFAKILVSKRHAAEALGICVRTLEKLIAGGKLPVVRIGRRILVPAAALERFARPRAIQQRVPDKLRQTSGRPRTEKS